MKLAWKIFCAAYCIVMVTVGAGGFALVQAASDSMADSRRDAVLTSNEYAGKMFYALAENGPSIQPRTKQIQDQIAKMVGTDQTERLTNGNAQETASYHSDSFVDRLASSQQGWTFVDMDGKPTLQAVTRVDFSGEPYYIETLSDFSGVYAQREQLMRVYRTTVVAAALLSGAALLGLSLAVTYPLRRLSQAANQVAAGDYERRVPVRRSSEEIRKLSEDFNTMAAAVENNVSELKQEIEKREIFVADFTHELKTPMTSIIGYADMLRSYDLDEEERREASDAIFREGKRLERLSMQLLQLLVLTNVPPTLVPVSAAPLFDDLKKSLRFLSEKYSVTVAVQAEPALVRAEPSLLLSLVYNLADNACKASPAGETVTISGRWEADGYRIAVVDHGRGIPAEHLDKITEPFYMEDKSRARRQGGAGLGLALCKRIADLHGTRLTFDSQAGRGTTVTLCLSVVGEAEEKGGGAV